MGRPTFSSVLRTAEEEEGDDIFLWRDNNVYVSNGDTSGSYSNNKEKCPSYNFTRNSERPTPQPRRVLFTSNHLEETPVIHLTKYIKTIVYSLIKIANQIKQSFMI